MTLPAPSSPHLRLLPHIAVEMPETLELTVMPHIPLPHILTTYVPLFSWNILTSSQHG
jgi:hypothetical protein